MTNSKVNLIFHPIRIRIIVEVSGRRVTAKKLIETMPDIPRTTLYRHIRALTEGGVLAIVEENQVRGTVERVYALNRTAADLTSEDLSQMTKKDYEQAFALLVTSLLGDFSRYLGDQPEEKTDLVAKGLRFGKVQLYLNEEEFGALFAQLNKSIESVLGNEPSHDRNRRIFSYTFIPTSDA